MIEFNAATSEGGRKGGIMCSYQNECLEDFDVKVWREGGAMSDHFLVEARLKLVDGGCEKCVEGE